LSKTNERTRICIANNENSQSYATVLTKCNFTVLTAQYDVTNFLLDGRRKTSSTKFLFLTEDEYLGVFVDDKLFVKEI
jgi:hypothetical protein